MLNALDKSRNTVNVISLDVVSFASAVSLNKCNIGCFEECFEGNPTFHYFKSLGTTIFGL